MTKNIIYITPDIIYAIRMDATPEFWRVNWGIESWSATIQDVKETLGTSELHVVLAKDAPKLSLLDQDISSSYTNALENAGCQILSIQEVENLSIEEVTAMFEGTPVVRSDLHLGSLEDLNVQTRESKPFPLKLILIILIAILVSGGVWLMFSSTLLGNTAPIPSPTPVATATATPTPTATPAPVVPSPKNQDFILQIQNGSGAVGLAGKLSAKLEAEGFVIKDVGNADNYNYAHAVLKAKAIVPESVKTSIQDVLTDSAWESDTLPSTSKYDIVIIMGKGSSLAN